MREAIVALAGWLEGAAVDPAPPPVAAAPEDPSAPPESRPL